MSRFGLIRLDDRLLHGQVALGWREALSPRLFWIVDDAVAADPFTAGLYASAAPEGTELRIDSIATFPLPPEPGIDLERTVVLVRSFLTLESLLDRNFQPPEVNIGGLHSRSGAKRYLDYLYLTDEDLAVVDRLLASGIALVAQDLPSSPRRLLVDLIGRRADK